MGCRGCDWIELVRQKRHRDFVAELAESYVLLADEQVYRGYCLLLLKGHQEHLAELAIERQLRLYEDVAQVAGALRRELQPRRLNYACLGNFMTHVHWHVIPRYADDPEALHPIWVRPVDERRRVLPATEHGELITRLRRALGR